jgi:hypothetical protein
MTEYELMCQLHFYDIMAGCESGGCAEFHMLYCFQNGACFYANLYCSAVAALEMGWA